MQPKRNDAPTEISTIDHVAAFIRAIKLSHRISNRRNITFHVKLDASTKRDDKISNASDVQRGEHSIMSRWWVVNADSNYRMEASPFTKNASRTPMTRSRANIWQKIHRLPSKHLSPSPTLRTMSELPNKISSDINDF